MSYVVRFAELGRGDVAVAGGKGANLGELTRAGLPVPPGVVLTTAAYRAFVDAIGDEILALAAEPDAAGGARIRALITSMPIPDAIAHEITEAWTALGGRPVAVRSSATAEDLEGASFAGQQDTYLNVHGASALLVAVRECWASLWTDRAITYRARQGIDPADVALAVVVQEMVEADAAGVMFTANPTNGRRDELVMSAAWGLGESVVSGSVTTDDLVVEKSTLRVTARTTADKAVMTVYAGDRTAEIAVPPERRTEPVLDDKAAAALAELGVRIEEHYGAPQDVEWARAGGEFFVVQARPITALPEPEAQAPTTWPVPDPKGYYFRASIVEQLPDPLSPLFAGMIDGSVERSLGALMRGLVGVELARAGELGLPTINGYAYYHYSRAALWRMTTASTRALKLLPTVGPARWRSDSHPRYVAAVEAWRDRPLDGPTDGQLLDGVLGLLDAGTTYYTAVQTIIPIAATSEMLFTTFYNRLVRRRGDPAASTFLLGFDSAPILAEKSLYDLAIWTRGHQELADAVRADPGRGACGSHAVKCQSGASRRVARPVPGPPRPLRPRHLQPGLRPPDACRGPGPAVRGAAFRPRRRRHQPVCAPGGLRGSSGGADGCRPRPPRSRAAEGVHPPAALGPGCCSGARGRAGRHRAGLAADAPHAGRAGRSPCRVGPDRRGRGHLLAASRRGAWRGGASGSGRGTEGAVAGAAAGHPAPDASSARGLHLARGAVPGRLQRPDGSGAARNGGERGPGDGTGAGVGRAFRLRSDAPG